MKYLYRAIFCNLLLVTPEFSLLFSIFVIFLATTSCSTPARTIQETGMRRVKLETSPIETAQLEQISCNPVDCKFIDYNSLSEVDEKINDEMSLNTGKILLDLKQNRYKLSDSEMDDFLAYLREITKRDGQVTIEPLYIKERSNLSDLPLIKDLGFTALDIYSRIRNTIKYRHTKNYNAKVIFHPKTHYILMIFFVHNSYGDICNTIYSSCNEIEYLDDETFDQSLSQALKYTNQDSKPVKVSFRQIDAKLFEAKLDLENMKKLNRTARLFKWLVLTKKTTKKPIKRERVIGLSETLSILNYSITLYDYYKDILLYAPARNVQAEVYYTGKEEGGKIESVVFYKY